MGKIVEGPENHFVTTYKKDFNKEPLQQEEVHHGPTEEEIQAAEEEEAQRIAELEAEEAQRREEEQLNGKNKRRGRSATRGGRGNN